MQFRAIAENADGETLELRFTSAGWAGAVHTADCALAREVENDELLKLNGPWIVRAVTLVFGAMTTIANSSQMIMGSVEQILLN